MMKPTDAVFEEYRSVGSTIDLRMRSTSPGGEILAALSAKQAMQDIARNISGKELFARPRALLHRRQTSRHLPCLRPRKAATSKMVLVHAV